MSSLVGGPDHRESRLNASHSDFHIFVSSSSVFFGNRTPQMSALLTPLCLLIHQVTCDVIIITRLLGKRPGLFLIRI